MQRLATIFLNAFLVVTTVQKLVSKKQKLESCPNVKCMSIHGYMHSVGCFCSFCSKMQIFQASVNVWPVSKVAIVRCLVIAGVTALDVPIDALVIMPTLTDAIQSMESVFANMAGKVRHYHNPYSQLYYNISFLKVFNVNPYVKLDVMVQTANSNVIVETMEALAKLNQVSTIFYR